MSIEGVLLWPVDWNKKRCRLTLEKKGPEMEPGLRMVSGLRVRVVK